MVASLAVWSHRSFLWAPCFLRHCISSSNLLTAGKDVGTVRTEEGVARKSMGKKNKAILLESPSRKDCWEMAALSRSPSTKLVILIKEVNKENNHFTDMGRTTSSHPATAVRAGRQRWCLFLTLCPPRSGLAGGGGMVHFYSAARPDLELLSSLGYSAPKPWGDAAATWELCRTYWPSPGWQQCLLISLLFNAWILVAC